MICFLVEYSTLPLKSQPALALEMDYHYRDIHRGEMELNAIHEGHDEASVSLKAVLLVFAVVIVGTLGYLVWQQNGAADTTNYAAPSVKNKTTTTQTTVADNAVACGDKAYAFELTFGTMWSGHKIKEVKPTDAIITCYIEMPTASTDAVWTAAATDHDAKYASLFAVSVYTPAQFTTASGDANAPTKLGSNTSYVWAYNQAQAIPTDLDAPYKDVKNIVTTFKITP
jgi:hypothetical protein